MNNNLGQLIKEGRKKESMSLVELSEKTMIDYSTLSGIETGRTKSPAMSMIVKIAEFIEIDDDLIKMACDMVKAGTLGEQVKDLRLKKDMSYGKLSKAAEVGIGSVYRIENDGAGMRLNTILSILEVLLDDEKDCQETIVQKLGRNIRYLRRKKGMSVQELANSIGGTIDIIYAIEEGKKKKVSKDLVQKLSEVLEASLMEEFE